MKRGKEDLSFVIAVQDEDKTDYYVPALSSMTNEKCEICEMTNDKSIAYSLRRLASSFLHGCLLFAV